MVHLYASAFLPVPIRRAWPVARDFNGLPLWHPMIRTSRIEDGRAADSVGCIRAIHTQNGDLVREQLLELSDHAHRVVYSILESHMGVSNYVATLQLRPVTDGDGCFAEWSAGFNCAPEAESALRQGIGQDVFAAGLRALGAHAAKT